MSNPTWLSEYADEEQLQQQTPEWLSEYEAEPDPNAEESSDPVDTFVSVSERITNSAPYAFFSNLGQTALGEFADEIGAAGRSLYDIATSDQYELRHYDDLYDINKQQIQDHYDQVDSASPIASVAGNVTGAVAGPAALAAGKYIAGANSVMGAGGRAVLAGAGEGALIGAGGAEEGERLAGAGEGAGWGAAGGGAGAAIGTVLAPIAKRAWRTLTNSQKTQAIKEIRDRALEYGVDPDEIIAMYNKNPDMTLADVDLAFRDMARGLGQSNPQAMAVGRETLTARNQQAPERIGEALEEASGIPLNRADDIAGEAQAARQELSPAYNEINEAPVPMGDKLTWQSDGIRYDHVKAGDELVEYLPLDIESSPAKKIIRLMPDEYNAALANYRRATKNPDFDPMEEGFIPGQMIQDMKTAADKTVNAVGSSGAQVGAARSVSQTLREIADEYIPGYGPLREEYGRRVMEPEAGLEAARGYMQGGWEKLQDILGRAGQLTEAGKEAFDAGVVRSANQAVRNASGAKGTQNYAGPLRRSETARDRVNEVIPDAKQSQFDEVLDDELTMHTTMSEVTGVGSPTSQNQASISRLGGGSGGSILGEFVDGFINKLARSESQVEAMEILVDSGLDEKTLREMLDSPYLGKPARDAIFRILSSENAGAAVGGAAGGLLVPEALN